MAKVDEARNIDRRMAETARAFGNLCVDGFHYLLLFVIGAAVVWAALGELVAMVSDGRTGIDEILLLFIYLELGAMVGIYFKTYRMPVRFLLYVSITVLTRMLIAAVNEEHEQPDQSLLYVTGAILLVALATLIIRIGSHRFPSAEPRERTDEPHPPDANRA